jgi:sorbose reductase
VFIILRQIILFKMPAARQSIRAPNPPVQDSVFKQFRLDGRTVIITGGAGGIGVEIAKGLAEAGANVSAS